MDLTNEIRGSVIMTDTDARILFASRGVSDRTGFDIPEIIGRRPSDLWGGRMDKPFYAEMWRFLSKGLPYANPVMNRRKDGGDLAITLSIAPLRDEHGTVAGYMALEPEETLASFRDEFLLAAAPDSAPNRIQALLEERFSWRAGQHAMHRTGLLALLDRTLVAPMRDRFRARLEDADLIRQAKENGEAFSALVAKYQGAVRRYFRHRLSDPELADDLMQETFERAFRALPAFRSSNASYQTYLLRIAHNLLVSQYRRHAPMEFQETSAQRAWIERIESEDEVGRAMLGLEIRDQEALHLYYREGYLMREIAEKWQASENAVKLRLSRARRRLAERMRRGGRGVR